MNKRGLRQKQAKKWRAAGFRTARELYGKLTKYDKYVETIGEKRKSMPKTNLDATFIRLKDDHMRNGQLSLLTTYSYVSRASI